MIDLFITTCIQRLHSSAHSCTRLHTTSAFICTLLHTSACYVHQLHVCTIYFCIDVWRTMPAYNHLVMRICIAAYIYAVLELVCNNCHTNRVMYVYITYSI